MSRQISDGNKKIKLNMAEFYNFTEKYLWEKGVLPVLKWVYIGIAGWFILEVLNKPIVNLKNTSISLIWAMLTLVIFYVWKKSGDKMYILSHNWTIGYIGEWLVARELNKLPKGFHVFYDVRIKRLGGNIDFVVVCPYDIYAVEVKIGRLEWFDWRNRNQAKNQAGALQKMLGDSGIKYVTPVLIYANQNKSRQSADNDVYVMGRKEIFDSFTKTMPLRRDWKYDPEKVKIIVSEIKSKILF